MTAKPEVDPVDALLRAHATQPLAARFLVGALAILAVVLIGWIAMALDRQSRAEMRQANGWESLGAIYAESRVSATTDTSWESAWMGETTQEGVSTYLYSGDDVRAWGERHKRLALQARSERPPEKEGD